MKLLTGSIVVVVAVIGALSGVQGDSGACRGELQGLRVLHQSLEAERCSSLLSGGWLVAHHVLRVAPA